MKNINKALWLIFIFYTIVKICVNRDALMIDIGGRVYPVLPYMRYTVNAGLELKERLVEIVWLSFHALSVAMHCAKTYTGRIGI